MFVIVPAYSPSNTSEDAIIQLSRVQAVRPHASVPVDPGAVSTTAVEVFFATSSIVVLLDIATMAQRLRAVTGAIDQFGSIL